ncbi:DMT family transporter [[Phormidium] sp. ETS-05]|uniref:DMT family transporter n=1 Tax=[Phormidium] sp. ETS-05 TaxID=222819 RepID=UPI0018EEE43B|nr:DMT family transporter [[Phormidium] sp. ETS-05]
MVNFWLANYKGELAALGAALLWASASVVYGRLGEKIPPLELNISKGAVAIALLLLTLLLRGDISSTTLAQLNPNTTTLLFLSGIVGIGFGDTAFFTAINNLGARRTLLLQTLAPPLAALLAMIFLRETLPQTTWLGIVITISGIAWVISDRAGSTTTTETNLLSGVTWGALAAAAQATGAVLSRAALATTNIDPLNSTLLRLMAGVFMLWLWAQGQKTPNRLNQLSPRLLLIVAVTAFFSTYLGIYCQQTSLKFAPAGIAQTLTATSPLFVIPIVIWMGERVSLRALLGAIISIAGVAVLFLR